MKSFFFALSMLTFGCSTLPRAGAEHVTLAPQAARPGALVSGPAILHLNSGGQGSVTIYLADDSGVRGDSCPTSAADHVAPLLVMKNADHVSDVPIPGGKRVCAVFEGADDLSLSWLAEVFPKSKAAEGAAPAVARGEALHGVVLARR